MMLIFLASLYIATLAKPAMVIFSGMAISIAFQFLIVLLGLVWFPWITRGAAIYGLIIGINLPSDDLISVILAKNFSDKQIKVEKKHIDYVIKRIDRSYEKISQFILTLDKYSLKKGSPFVLKLIKEVLKMI